MFGNAGEVISQSKPVQLNQQYSKFPNCQIAPYRKKYLLEVILFMRIFTFSKNISAICSKIFSKDVGIEALINQAKLAFGGLAAD